MPLHENLIMRDSHKKSRNYSKSNGKKEIYIKQIEQAKAAVDKSEAADDEK